MPSRRASKMERLEAIGSALPEVQRVDIEAWGDEPTFRVNSKNFIFSDQAATGISVKLTKEEATAVCATDPWVRTSYTLVAPKRLAWLVQ